MYSMENFEETKGKVRQDRLFLWSSLGTLIIGVFFMVLFILSFFYPKTDLRITGVTVNGSEHVRHGHFVRGDELNFRISICKITNLPVSVSVELFDGDKDNLPLITKVSTSQKGCVNLIVGGIVPLNAPLGEYNVKVVAHQDINPRREAHVELVIPNMKIVDLEH